MANSQQFLQKVLAGLSALGEVTTRPMFGGHGVFLDARMFALIAGDTLYFKADDENRGAYDAEGMKPYGKMPYYQTPPAAMSDPARLAVLGREAVAASLRGNRKKRNSSRGKGKPGN